MALLYGDDLQQTAPSGSAIRELQVPTLTDRDRVGGDGTLRVGGRCFVDADLTTYELLTAAPTWKVADDNEVTLVADVVARDAIPSAGRFESMFVESQASGIVWRLRADLTTWDIVANYASDLFEFNADLLVFGIFEKVHDVYAETTGSDIAGEGTVANPFETVQGAIDSVPNAAGAVIQIHLGLGTFVVGELVPRSASARYFVIGTEVVVEAMAAPSGFANVPGKESQIRNTYAVAPTTPIVEGTHFYVSDFGLAIPDFFKAHRVLLASSAGNDLDMLGLSTNFDGDIVTLGTTVSSLATLGMELQDAGAGAIHLCNLTAVSNLALQNAALDGCNIAPTGTLALGGFATDGGKGSVFSCFVNPGNGILAPSAWAMLQSLVPAGAPILEMAATGSLEICTLRRAGEQVRLGDSNAFNSGTLLQCFVQRNDHENATLCFDVRWGRLFMDFVCTVAGCTKFAKVAGALEFDTSDVIGNCSGDAIEVAPGGFVKGVANLASLTATGRELVVAGVGRTFATAPHTDIGELSQVRP